VLLGVTYVDICKAVRTKWKASEMRALLDDAIIFVGFRKLCEFNSGGALHPSQSLMLKVWHASNCT